MNVETENMSNPRPADAGYFDSEHADVAMTLVIKERVSHGLLAELGITRRPHGPVDTISLNFDVDKQRF